MTVNGRTRGLVSCSLFLMLVVSLPPPPSHAVPLEPSATVLTPGTTLTDRPELEGDIIESSAVPFMGRNALDEVVFTGTLVEAVVSEHGTSTLDFYYAIVNDVGSRQGITTLAARSFADFLTDVDSLADSGGDVGTSSATRDLSGSIVQFNFANSVLPGQTSNFLFIKTDSLTFGAGTVVLTSDAATASIQVFAPVPEPTSVLLLGVGVLLLVVGRWKETLMSS